MTPELNPYEPPQIPTPGNTPAGLYRGAIIGLFVAQLILAAIGVYLFGCTLDDKGLSTPAFIRALPHGIIYVPPLAIFFLAFINFTLARVIGSTVIAVLQILLLVVPAMLLLLLIKIS